MAMNQKDADFFRPLWRRVAVTGVVAAWFCYETFLAVPRDTLRRFRALCRVMKVGRVHAIALEALFEGVLAWLRWDSQLDEDALQEAALADYRACGARGRLSFMDRGLTVGRATTGATPPRQARHLHVGG